MTLFNTHSLRLHKERSQKTGKDHAFLFAHVEKEMTERVLETHQSFEKIIKLSPEISFPKEEPFDLILSCLQAHWTHDLPQFLTTIRLSLTPKGLFLGALYGGQSLFELRESLLQAELALTGGASPRVAPMVQLSDAPILLSRAGFSNPVVDIETITITYPSLVSLMHDLRGMGETNIVEERQKTFTSRHLFEKAEAIYKASYGLANGTLPVTVQVIYLTGWGSG